MKKILTLVVALCIFSTVSFSGTIDDLTKACMKGDLAAVQKTVAAGADVNAKDQGGWTPLHFAAYEGKTEYFNLLIAKGADVNVKTLKGETPLKLAMSKAHLGLADILREKGAKED